MDWCEVCVKARGKERESTKYDGKEKDLPQHSLGYCFPGDEVGYRWTFWVEKKGPARRARQL
eukprot:10691687-Karenia_brevis.AAC.1